MTVYSKGPSQPGAPQGGRRICIYVHISVYLRAFSSAWAPRGALSLRFQVFGGLGRSELTFSNVSGPLALSPYACAAKRSSNLKVGFFPEKRIERRVLF